MTARPSPTPQQREQQMSALRARLEAEVAGLARPQGWAAYLSAAAHLPGHHARNVLLIAAAHPGASEVASYGAWQAAGRQVRKGEKALSIMGSRLIAAHAGEQEDQRAPGSEIGPAHTGPAGTSVREVSYPVRVFDLAQTEPAKTAAPGPAPAPEPQPGTPDLYARIAAHLSRQAIAVRRLVVPGCADGLCRKIPPASAPLSPERCWVVEVVIDVRCTREQGATAMIHQGAHIAAGHLEAAGDYVAHRGRPEVEAAAATFMVTTMAGQDHASPTGYDPAWMSAASPADLLAAATTASSTAHALAAALGLSAQRDSHAPAA